MSRRELRDTDSHCEVQRLWLNAEVALGSTSQHQPGQRRRADGDDNGKLIASESRISIGWKRMPAVTPKVEISMVHPVHSPERRHHMEQHMLGEPACVVVRSLPGRQRC